MYFECIYGWLNFDMNHTCPICRRHFPLHQTAIPSRQVRLRNRRRNFLRHTHIVSHQQLDANEETNSSPSQPSMNHNSEADNDDSTIEELEPGSGSPSSPSHLLRLNFELLVG